MSKSTTQEPTGRTAWEMAEERNAKHNCPHPESCQETDLSLPGEVRTFCNLCEQYIDDA